MAGKPPSSTPQIYAFGTTVARPYLTPPTYDRENIFPEPVQTVTTHCPRAPPYQRHPHSQHSPLPRSRSRDNIPYARSRSGPICDPLNGGRPSAQSTPRGPLEAPPPIWYINSKNIDPYKIVPQPELTIKELDDLGLPYFDLRYQLPESVSALGTPRFQLKQPSVTSARIISLDFPWNIDITKSRDHGNITWKDMLEAVYNGLHKQIEDYEWPLLILDRDPQYRVDIETTSNTRVNDPDRTPWTTKADQSRRPSRAEDRNLKRIDFLGRKTAFLGFKKNKDLEEMRRMPHSKLPISEVWVVELGPSGRRSRGRRIIS